MAICHFFFFQGYTAAALVGWHSWGGTYLPVIWIRCYPAHFWARDRGAHFALLFLLCASRSTVHGSTRSTVDPRAHPECTRTSVVYLDATVHTTLTRVCHDPSPDRRVQCPHCESAHASWPVPQRPSVAYDSDHDLPPRIRTTSLPSLSSFSFAHPQTSSFSRPLAFLDLSREARSILLDPPRFLLPLPLSLSLTPTEPVSNLGLLAELLFSHTNYPNLLCVCTCVLGDTP